MKKIVIISFIFFSCFMANAQKQDTSIKKTQAVQGFREGSYRASPAVKTDPNDYIFCTNCEDQNVILYDFDCKKLYYKNTNGGFKPVKKLSDIKVRYNKELRFKVINVNRYIYDVSFSVDDIDFGSEPPALFNQLFLGNGDYLDGLLKSLAPAEEAFGEDVLAPFTDKLKKFKEKYDQLVDNYVKVYTLHTTLGCREDITQVTFSELSKELYEVRETYFSVSRTISEMQVEADQYLAASKADLERCHATVRRIGALEAEIRELKKNEVKNSKQIAAKQGELESITRCDTTSLKEEVVEKESTQKKIVLAKEAVEEIWIAYIKPTDEQLLQMALFHNNMGRQHLYYLAPPVYPQGHRLSFGLKISPRDTGSSLISKWNSMPLYKDSLGFDVTVVNKFYVSFSSGLFAGFGKNLRDDTYEFQPQVSSGNTVTDSAQYKLVSTGQAAPPFGFAAFANIGFKFDRGFSAGVSVGAGISIEDKPRPVYLGGLSLLFGNKQQFNMTFGVAAMQAKKLKADMYPDISNVVYDTKPSIEYKKKLEAGGFVAITYTLFTPGSKKGVTSGQ
jgi:hypothetical protein